VIHDNNMTTRGFSETASLAPARLLL
jgi:hypothetical protein